MLLRKCGECKNGIGSVLVFISQYLFMHKYLNSRLIMEIDFNLVVGDWRTEFPIVFQDAKIGEVNLFNLQKNKTFCLRCGCSANSVCSGVSMALGTLSRSCCPLSNTQTHQSAKCKYLQYARENIRNRAVKQ